MSDNTNMIKNFAKQINNYIENKTSNMTSVTSATVYSINPDGTVNIQIPPGTAVYHNIQNQSIYRKLKPGDNIKILKENNDLSNMWVIGKFNPSPDDLEYINVYQTIQKELESIQSAPSQSSSISQDDINRLKQLIMWQQQVYEIINSIPQIQSQTSSNTAEINTMLQRIQALEATVNSLFNEEIIIDGGNAPIE